MINYKKFVFSFKRKLLFKKKQQGIFSKLVFLLGIVFIFSMEYGTKIYKVSKYILEEIGNSKIIYLLILVAIVILVIIIYDFMIKRYIIKILKNKDCRLISIKNGKVKYLDTNGKLHVTKFTPSIFGKNDLVD